MGQEFFSTYQAGQNMQDVFRQAKKNALIYHGAYHDNGSIATVKNVRLWKKGAVPRGYATRLESLFLEQEKDMAVISGEECLAVQVADDDSFETRAINLLLSLEQKKPHLNKEDVYRKIEENTLLSDQEMIVKLNLHHLKEENKIEKSQGALMEEDIYVLAHEGQIDIDNPFLLASEAEREALRRSSEEGGTHSVFLLKRGSDGQPLFQSTFLRKNYTLQALVTLAKAKRQQKMIGWHFFGFAFK